MNQFFMSVDENLQKKEKHKARDLKQSQWWKRKRSLGLCYYCRNNFPPKELTMDHIVPIARGGKSVKSNVAACCKECNTKKKQMLPIEWEEYMNSQVNKGTGRK
ncbi:MAG: HNH endonuclease [Thermodesulfobacteriota bacterium]|nr:HNH endonuclease [Thermodesulfobacteriota bacterium]